MAKLLIFRGDTLHSTVELTEQTVQIGRSAENKIVLEDPGKGVSRVHAEIRFEGGRYVLFDRESQNGIWVSGRRVASVVLDPEVIATLGPFRLSVEAPVPVSAGAGSDTATEYTHLSEHPTEPIVLGDLGPLPAPPAPPRPVQDLSPSKGRQWSVQPRLWFVTGAAVLLIAVLAIVAYKLLHKPSGPTWDRNLAQALVDGGKCQEALDTQINPALEVDPNNLEARTLRDKCAAPPQPAPPPMTTTSPPTPSVAERLDEAEGLITAKDCLKALDAINLVLADDPNNERAKELFREGEHVRQSSVRPDGLDRGAGGKGGAPLTRRSRSASEGVGQGVPERGLMR